MPVRFLAPALSSPARPTRPNLPLIGIAATNATAVAGLYWNQALARVIAGDVPHSAALLSCVPGATLAGYATGVAIIAFGPTTQGRFPIAAQTSVLVLGLAAAGLSPTALALVIASFFVGCGAAVAQRLLAAAAQLGGPAGAGTAIGKTLCAALIGILCVRLGGDSLGRLLGWRAVFLAAAAAVAVTSVVCVGQAPTLSQPAAPCMPGAMLRLWRSCALLRWAALQQGAIFAAYNAAWMTLLVELPPGERFLVVIVGGGAGVVAALLSGRFVDKYGQHDLACIGAAAALAATGLLLPAAYGVTPGVLRVLLLVAGMALLDAGLQVVLVANQTRVQALLPMARSRLAALLTVFGSLGGALGAGAGYGLWQLSGWQAAIALAAIMGLLGFGCSLLALAWRRTATRKERAPQGQPPLYQATALCAAHLRTPQRLLS